MAWGQLNGTPVIAFGDGDGVRVWDAATGRLLRTMPSDSSVNAVAWGQLNGTPVIAFDDGDGVRVWDAATGRLLRTMPSDSSVNAVAWGQLNGTPVIASGDGDGVRVWDAATGRLLRTMPSDSSVNAVAWGQLNGTPVIASGDGDGDTDSDGDSDGGVRVWDAATGRLLRTMPSDSSVNAVAWGQLNGTPVIASGDGDGYNLLGRVSDGGGVRVWDAATGRLLGPCLPTVR